MLGGEECRSRLPQQNCSSGQEQEEGSQTATTTGQTVRSRGPTSVIQSPRKLNVVREHEHEGAFVRSGWLSEWEGQ